MSRTLRISSLRFLAFPKSWGGINFCSIANQSEEMSLSDNLEKSRIQLVDIFNAGVAAVQPASIVENCVSVVGDEMKIRDKTYKLNENISLIGFGKAVMGMAAMMENKLGKRLKQGIVSVPRGSKNNYYRRIEEDRVKSCFPNFNGPIVYRESSKDNQPDEDTLITSHDIIDLAESLDEKDTLIILISGGGSALFFMPRPIIESETKLRFCQKLQNSGADIKELNTVRKKLSMVKGGGLALMAHPAKIITLILSDIVGDPMDLIASGPTIYSEKSPERVMSILRKYNLHDKVDGDLKSLLTQKELKIDEKTLLDSSKEFRHVDNFVIGNNTIAMNAASQEARRKGLTPIIARNDIVGDVRTVSESYAEIASLVCRAWNKDIERKDFVASMKSDQVIFPSEEKMDEIIGSLENPDSQGIILIGGGEPEVTVRGNGRGGRNQELALSFSIDFLARVKKFPQLTNYDVLFLSAGTDGQDGPTDAAGAFGYPAIEPTVKLLLGKLRKISNEHVIAEASSKNNENTFELDAEISSKLAVAERIVPRNALMNNDSYNFYSRFKRGKDLLKTGITGTNVMDLHFLLIKKRECGCNLDFERKAYCQDPLEEHDLHEDVEERVKRLRMEKNEIEDRKIRLLNLKILDSSLTENCCRKKFH